MTRACRLCTSPPPVSVYAIVKPPSTLPHGQSGRVQPRPRTSCMGRIASKSLAEDGEEGEGESDGDRSSRAPTHLTSAPLIMPAASLHRCSIVLATSSGSANRPVGIFAWKLLCVSTSPTRRSRRTYASRTAASAHACRPIAVHTTVGDTVLLAAPRRVSMPRPREERETY